MLETTNPAANDVQSTGFAAWLRSLFIRLFQSVGMPGTEPAARGIDVGDDVSGAASGAFVLADGGYRIRVPHPSDVGHSVGDLLPTVRQGLNLLPPLPTVVIELLREIQDSRSTAASVAEVASSDPALAASLLRTANGAAMGLARTITSVSEAVSYLGFGTVKAMVIRLRLDEVLACKNEQAAHDSEDLWVHSLAVSYAAEELAKKVGGIDAGFVATLGLLHDIGKLAVLAQLPEAAESLRTENSDRNSSRLAIEARILGMDHAGLGANLAAKWKLPADLVQAIRCHHRPAGAFHPTDPLPLRKAVHVMQIANQLVKYCYPHSDRMEIDAIADDVFVLLGLEPSLPNLLTGGVRDSISRAIFFATSNNRRPASASRRFLRPLGREEGLAVLASPAGSEPRITVDENLVASLFSEGAKEIQIQGERCPSMEGIARARFIASAVPAGIEKCIAAAVAHQEALSLDAEIRAAAALTVKSLLPNLLPMSAAGETIEVVQCKEGRRFMLAVRAAGLEASRRLGSNTRDARRLIEADMANLLNLGWYEQISISSDAATLVFVAEAS